MENIIDFDRCMEAGALCSTELEFYKRFPLEAKASIMNGWHDEVCANMTVLITHILKKSVKRQLYCILKEANFVNTVEKSMIKHVMQVG